VNERRTVVGVVDWPLCVPQPWREIDTHVHRPMLLLLHNYVATSATHAQKYARKYVTIAMDAMNSIKVRNTRS